MLDYVSASLDSLDRITEGRLLELVRSARLIGLARLLKLNKGYRAGWQEMFGGYMAMTTLQGLLSVGLLDEMRSKSSVNPQAFAASADLDADILESVCQALYSAGLFERSNGNYSLSERGKLLTDVLRGWLEVSYGYSEVFWSLPDMLRKRKVYGKDFYRKSDYVATGSGEMENWLFFPLANQIVLERGYRKILDLGCGDGTFLRELCRINKDVRCYGIDLAPAAIEEGKRRARQAGLDERISLLAADVQADNLIPDEYRRVDAATIFFVLHEILYLGEDRLLAFLKGFRKNFPNIPLIAFEAIRPTADEMRRQPGIAIYYFLYHDLTHQKPIGRDEWKRVFRAAGFTSIEERYLDFARTAVYTVS